MSNAAETAAEVYEVGGVRMPRPFKLRRLGHLGLNLANLGEGLRFYTEELGFRVTDAGDLSEWWAATYPDEPLAEPKIYFTTNSADHHVVVLANMGFSFLEGGEGREIDDTFNQITWQVGSLREVVEAERFLRDRGVPIRRAGRDMPGSNWAVYFGDPDGHAVELYYGIEQIGWQRRSKPAALHDGRREAFPELPVHSETAELRAAAHAGTDMGAGTLSNEPLRAPERFDVGGILLPRPFKVTRLGPVSLFTDRFEAMSRFYQDILGFRVIETIEYQGGRIAYLSTGAEHHSLVLADKSLRSTGHFSATTSCMALGMEVGSYTQLRDAVGFLSERGWKVLDLPSEMYAGIDYAAHVQDPDGHLVQLYYYMEQLGWDRRPRPAAQRREAAHPWPDAVDALSDTYADQTFQGPIG